MDRQPAQAEAPPSERCNRLRQLVPVISPAAAENPEARIASATTVHDPHPDHPQLPDDYSIEDANADLFG